jgi:CBS domain-containing protein
MAALGDLPLVDASIRDSESFAAAVAELFEARVPAIAVLDSGSRLLGVVSEADVLRALFPGYLGELWHTSFLEDDAEQLVDRAKAVCRQPVRSLAREVEALDANESETHAAERFLHASDQALPVVHAGRFVGMLSIAALCHARLARAEIA